MHSLLPALGLIALAGCSRASDDSPRSPGTTVPPAALPSTPPDDGTEVAGDMEPVVHWKSERKRIARLGLAYDTGRAVRAEAEARDVLEGLDAEDIESLEAAAKAEYARNDQLAAIASWTRVVLLEPTPERWVSLGRSLRGFKMADEAEAAFRTALDLDPDHASAVLEVAQLDAGHGDFAAAIDLYRRAAELAPRDGEPWARLARLHFLGGDDALAREAVVAAQARGARVPSQLIAALEERSPVDPTDEGR
ncbi:MAG: tetratricopeptide repeat protein [Planctomycetota bacterium]